MKPAAVKTDKDSQYPVRLLTALLILTMVAVLGMAWTLREHHDLRDHAVMAVFAVMLVVIWIYVMKLLRNWREVILHKNLELRELNKTLDEKVKARTQQLEDQRKVLEIANRDLQKNEAAVRAMYKDIKKVHEEYKHTQVQLIQSEKLASIGQLAAGIAHEINNPIGYIGSNIQTMTKYVEDMKRIFDRVDLLKKAVELKAFDKAQEYVAELKALELQMNLPYILKDTADLLKESHNGIDRIRRIVMDLKSFSRKDKDEASLINLHEVLEEVLNILNNELKYTCQIVKEYQPIPQVKVNPQKMGQVFMNLLLNAKQSIRNSGTITIRTYQKETLACIEIADTGVGIPADDMPNIFLPFFTTKPVGIGTGLGLSISYDIVKSYHGEIQVRTEVDKGSAFTVLLPTKF